MGNQERFLSAIKERWKNAIYFSRLHFNLLNISGHPAEKRGRGEPELIFY
jgi:hypothetical protein